MTTELPRFVIIKLFACPKCKRPKLVRSESPTEPDVETLHAEISDVWCRQCDWRGRLPGDQAEWLQVVPWNP